jgi:hypothetical protein
MTYWTAAQVVNQVAAETFGGNATDVYSSPDPAFIQLRTLLNSAGMELLGLHTWQKMIRSHTITTQPGDTGDYPLPADFGWMIDQTGWTPTSGGMGLPLGGPLSPQDWTYLVATNLASSTVYVSFRIQDGLLRVLPQPPSPGIQITFEYVSRNWVADPGTTIPAKNAASANDDVILYEWILITKFLKLRFLGAKGFDTTSASQEFRDAFMQWTGHDIPAPVLNAARVRVFPYLGWRNIPETNFGLP